MNRNKYTLKKLIRKKKSLKHFTMRFFERLCECRFLKEMKRTGRTLSSCILQQKKNSKYFLRAVTIIKNRIKEYPEIPISLKK